LIGRKSRARSGSFTQRSWGRRKRRDGKGEEEEEEEEEEGKSSKTKRGWPKESQ
jgi:hypothetical protein